MARILELKTDSRFAVEIYDRLAERGVYLSQNDPDQIGGRTLALVSHMISRAASGRDDPDWARDGSVSEADLDYLVDEALAVIRATPYRVLAKKQAKKRRRKKR